MFKAEVALSNSSGLINNKYPEISYMWLCKGEGSMLITNPDYFINAHDRIKHIMNTYKLDSAEFVKKTGLNLSIVVEIVMEDKEPSRNVLMKIYEAFPELNLGWLLNNEGLMFAKAERIISDSKNYHPKVLSPIDIYNINIPDNIGDQFTYIMRGISMEPIYCQGDVLGCRIVDKLSIIEWGRNYFIQTINGNIIRKLLPSSNNEIILQSNLPENFPNVKITINDILKLAIITGSVKYE